MPQTADETLKHYDSLLGERAPHESDWRELSDYCALARQTALTGNAPGSKVTGKVFDSISFLAPFYLAASMGSFLTPPHTPWQRMKIRQEELWAIDAVQDWCDDGRLRFHAALGASTFAADAGTAYLDLPVFGTTALFIGERPAVRRPRVVSVPGGGFAQVGWQTFSGFRFEVAAPGSYVIAKDAQGRVDTLMRSQMMTARQIVQEYGIEKLPDRLAKLYHDKPYETAEIIHAVYPRDDADQSRSDNRNFPWASQVIFKEGKDLLAESGFHEFPWAVPQWLVVSGQTWAIGQGHLVLPDIKTLNTAVQLRLDDWALLVRPPLFHRNGSVVGGRINWVPAGQNAVNGNRDSVWTMQSGSRVSEAIAQEDRAERKIREGFFTDQILALPRPSDDKIGGMSPYEVSLRQAQMLRILGPVYGQLDPSWLQKIPERGLRLMFRGGALAPLPPELAMRPDADIDIISESPMSRAQRSDEAVAIDDQLQFTAQVAEAQLKFGREPDILDTLDLDEASRVRAYIKGVPAKIVRGGDVVAQIRADRAQAKAQQQQQQDLLAMTEGAKNMAPMVKALQPQGGQGGGQ